MQIYTKIISRFGGIFLFRFYKKISNFYNEQLIKNTYILLFKKITCI